MDTTATTTTGGTMPAVSTHEFHWSDDNDWSMLSWRNEGGDGPVYELADVNGQRRRYAINHVIVVADAAGRWRQVSFYGWPVTRRGRIDSRCALAYGTANYDEAPPVPGYRAAATFVGVRGEVDGFTLVVPA